VIAAAIVPPAATPSSVFVKADTTTAGSWIGTYGADGYSLIGDVSSIPTHVPVTPSGNSSWTWAASIANPAALQKASSPTDRLAACWYSVSSFDVDLNFNDGKAHQVAFYLLNWDSTRSERIDILDLANNVLDSQTVSN